MIHNERVMGSRSSRAVSLSAAVAVRVERPSSEMLIAEPAPATEIGGGLAIWCFPVLVFIYRGVPCCGHPDMRGSASVRERARQDCGQSCRCVKGGVESITRYPPPAAADRCPDARILSRLPRMNDVRLMRQATLRPGSPAHSEGWRDRPRPRCAASQALQPADTRPRCAAGGAPGRP